MTTPTDPIRWATLKAIWRITSTDLFDVRKAIDAMTPEEARTVYDLEMETLQRDLVLQAAGTKATP